MTLLSQMSNIWQLSKQDMYFAVCLFMSLTKNYKTKQFHGAWRSFDKRNSQLIKRPPVQKEPMLITTIRNSAISLRQITVDFHSATCVFLSLQMSSHAANKRNVTCYFFPMPTSGFAYTKSQDHRMLYSRFYV